MNVDWVGWLSSGILIVTLVQQIRKQWRGGREPRGEGVSPWFFMGQFAASVGFSIYSALVRNWVFTITNSVLALNAAIGCAITMYNAKTYERPAAHRDAKS